MSQTPAAAMAAARTRARLIETKEAPMPFRIPQLNITCNVYHVMAPLVIPPLNPPDIAALPCQLRMARMVAGLVEMAGEMHLLVSKGTDLRDYQSFTGDADVVECPAGTGRFYVVTHVDDVAKGFANEYRAASIVHPLAFGYNYQWPTPYP